MILLAEEVSSHTFNYMGQFFNMIFTLAIVLGLIFVSVLFLKKIMRTKMRELNRSTGIKILEKRVLSQKASLYLVDVLGKGIVISESAAGVQLVTEFAQGTDIELLLAEEHERNKSEIPLTKTLSKFFKKKGASSK